MCAPKIKKNVISLMFHNSVSKITIHNSIKYDPFMIKIKIK